MTIQVDVWLRGHDVATTESFEASARAPKAWSDEDVRLVLEGMLRAMHHVKHQARPGEPEPPIVLRGLSWIVNPFEDGGVVIAIEIGLGAAIAGPFDIDKTVLEEMISRVLVRPVAPASTRVH